MSHSSITQVTSAQCFRFPSISEFSVADYRASTGLSQQEFAQLHGIKLSTLRKWEQHQSEPRMSTVSRVLDAWIETHFPKRLAAP